MVKITSLLEKNREWTSLGDKAKIVPVFISVDPERDTVARVKKYCEEFSPKIRGYTGSSEQVRLANFITSVHVFFRFPLYAKHSVFIIAKVLLQRIKTTTL